MRDAIMLRCPTDFKSELRRLVQELLLLQLELLKTLADDPAGYVPQLTLISKAFSNVQHLINCLRPYQASGRHAWCRGWCESSASTGPAGRALCTEAPVWVDERV